MKKSYIFIFLYFVLLGAFTTAAYLYVYLNKTVNTDTFYTGVTVDEVDLAGLTRESAEALLYQANRSRLDDIKIKVEYGSKQWVFGFKDIQASLDIEKKLDQAFLYGRNGHILQRYLIIRKIETSGYSLKTEMTYNPDYLADKLQEITSELYKAPVNASIKFEADAKQKFIVSPEIEGLKINTSGIIDKIKDNLYKGIYNMTIPLIAEKIQPEVKAGDFTGKTEKIVSFGTDLSKSSPDRTNNVLKAASAFNGLVVLPGQIISFNDTTGKRTSSKGYKNAPMILDNRFVDVPGGGVSQTSTTLYNAVIRADLEVIERTRHSIPSSYMDKGLDTTVNFEDPEIDLTFKNTKKSPIYIRTFYTDNKVYFEIYGEPLPNHGELKFHSELYETVPAPEPSVIQDLEGKYVSFKDQRHIYRDSRPGYKVRVHKELYENGELIETTLFDQHYYIPIKGLIHAGIKENEPPINAPLSYKSAFPAASKPVPNSTHR